MLIPLCFELLKPNGVLHFTSCYSALSFRVLTPSLLLLVVGVSNAFVPDWSGKDNWIFFSSGSRSGSLIWYISVPGLAYLYSMWALFGLFFSLIWDNLEPRAWHNLEPWSERCVIPLFPMGLWIMWICCTILKALLSRLLIVMHPSYKDMWEGWLNKEIKSVMHQRDSLLPAVTTMVNLSLETGYFADTWKTFVLYQSLKKPGPQSPVQEFLSNKQLAVCVIINRACGGLSDSVSHD